MEHKKTKKHDGGGLYIAICCCILVIALIGYANNLAEKNKEEERLLTQEAGENIVAPEAEVPTPVFTPEPTAAPEPERSASLVTPSPEAQSVAKAQPVEEEPLLLTPVNGGVMSEFSDNKQVYHSSLDDWRTHNGIDLGASVGDSVSAAGDGVVSRVYMGSLGYSVRIDHSEGMSTIYSNLDENPTVAIGDNVKKGDVIGHVGASALGDMTTEPHLHFEVILDGAYQNPAQYLQ